MQPDINHISAFFSLTTFRKGRSYKSQVTDITVRPQKQGFELEGRVQGSRATPYTTSATLRLKPALHVRGHCSCPVSINCKHVVALILAVMDQKLLEEQPATTGHAGVDAWIAPLRRTSTDEQTSQFALFYCLHVDKSGKIGTVVQTRRHLKVGGYGKPKTIDHERYTHSYTATPEYFTEADIELIELITAVSKDAYYRQWVPLDGALGSLIIQKALQSGRCYLDDETQLLQAGEPLTFAAAWEKARGRLRLTFTAAGTKARLLPVDPCLYLDAKRLQIGPALGIDYDTATLKLLLASPPVEEENATALSRALLKELPSLHLPLPTADTIPTFRDDPRFHLTLDAAEQLQAKLQIAYAETFVTLDTLHPEEVLENPNGTLLRILRDAEAEHAATTQLASAGLTAMATISRHERIYTAQSAEEDRQRALARWHRFMQTEVPRLQDAGWIITFDTEITFTEVPALEVQVDDHIQWFDLSLGLTVGQTRYDAVAVVAKLLTSLEPGMPLPETLYLPIETGHVAAVPGAAIEPMIDTLFELFGTTPTQGHYRLNSFDAPVLARLQNSATQFSGAERLSLIAEQLRTFEKIEPAALPQGLQATLRSYQHEGFSWMQFLRTFGFGGILADDMGLGKTVQTLTHLLCEKEQGRMRAPTLIVAPTSLMGNWKREAAKFTPALRVLVLQGMERKHHFDDIPDYDLVLSTYPLIARDFETLSQMTYYYLILDEAQNIKNHRSKAAQHLRALRAEHRLCLTGTPMENHLGELWGLFDFLMPGLLFEQKFFNETFRTPIEKTQDSRRRALLNDRIRPFLLRRTKNEVATELPPKTEMVRTVPLEAEQARLYESIRIAMDAKVKEAIKEKGLARSHIMILDALLKLRQACCDPRLVKLEQAENVTESAKFDLLFELLDELIEEGRRILLFSQFTQMLTLIQNELERRSIAYTKLTGATRKRDEAIEAFRRGDIPLFLISLKAGGVGLNLTEADTVIHYDPWWNPAAEQQATDRAYRIGQDKPVFVYKLITENTVEEKILQLQQRKQELAQSVYENKDAATGLTQEDLQALFAPQG